MEVIEFDRQAALPIIDARIHGPRRSHKVKLIFDTGATIQYYRHRLRLLPVPGYCSKFALNQFKHKLEVTS